MTVSLEGPAVEVSGLSKFYGDVRAVDGLDLAVPDGSIFGLVGPNGAGKTTTMSILAGLLQPSSGSVRVCGVDPVRKPNALRRAVGYMPDFFGVYEALSVAEYLGFFCRAYRVPSRQHANLIAELLALVDLAGLEDRQVDDLSRGMKQRLCLARALVHDPSLLILDEPASGLDPRARVEMRELLFALRELGKTVLISSHILAELQDLCTHVAIVDHGHVVAAGSLETLRTEMGTPRVRIGTLPGAEPALAEAAFAAGLTVLGEEVVVRPNGASHGPGLVLAIDDPAAVAAAVAGFVARGVPVTEVVPIRAGLEELFMRITGDAPDAPPEADAEAAP